MSGLKRQEAIDELVAMRDELHPYISLVGEDAYDMALADMKAMQYLDGRPCTVCKAHSPNGCGLWSCVFNGV